MRFIRFKAISECIGIRRSSVAYFNYFDNQAYDVSKYEHPLNSLKTIKINKACISFLDQDFDIDHPINFQLKATSLGNEITEYCHLDVMFIEINDKNVDLLKDKFNDYFDEYKGEYEFLVGLYYYNNDKKNEAMEYFKVSKEKGFKLASNYFND